jgi:hypothetical protein
VGRADEHDDVLGDGERVVDGGPVPEVKGLEAADDDGEVIGLHLRSVPLAGACDPAVMLYG